MEKILKYLLDEKFYDASRVAKHEYPFVPLRNTKRKYTDNDMMSIFSRDGFIDRYSGDRLLNPGVLRLLNDLMPEEFPFHAHGKMDLCHEIYWTLLPSVDHLIPISRGGKDEKSNWVTTSMKRNLVKNLWLLEELGWKLRAGGDINDWDGCSKIFMSLVEKYKNKCSSYVMRWYRITRKHIEPGA